MAEIDTEVTNYILDQLRWTAAQVSETARDYRQFGSPDALAMAIRADEIGRRWTQLADDVAAGRLAELDAIEAAAAEARAIDVNAAVRHPNDTDTNGAGA